jgi:hypothetical protein
VPASLLLSPAFDLFPQAVLGEESYFKRQRQPWIVKSLFSYRVLGALPVFHCGFSIVSFVLTNNINNGEYLHSILVYTKDSKMFF